MEIYKKVINHIKGQAKPEYNDNIIEKTNNVTYNFSSDKENEDPLFLEAKEIVLKAKKASATLLQRRLRIGYPRAASLLDMLEEVGIVGPAEGSKPREILISQEDLEENFSSDLDSKEENISNEKYEKKNK